MPGLQLADLAPGCSHLLRVQECPKRCLLGSELVGLRDPRIAAELQLLERLLVLPQLHPSTKNVQIASGVVTLIITKGKKA